MRLLRPHPLMPQAPPPSHHAQNLAKPPHHPPNIMQHPLPHPPHLPRQHLRRIPRPLHPPPHILNLPQRLPQPHHPTPYHPWINRHSLVHQALRRGRGVEAHDEVVPGVVSHLMLLYRLGEQEGAPVGQAADDAPAGED